MRPFYIWEDANDPYACGPCLKEDPRFASKAAAKADYKAYVEDKENCFDWTPMFALYRITVEKL